MYVCVRWIVRIHRHYRFYVHGLGHTGSIVRRGILSMTFASLFHFYFIFCRHTASPQERAHGGTALIFMAQQLCWRQNLGPPLKNDPEMIQIRGWGQSYDTNKASCKFTVSFALGVPCLKFIVVHPAKIFIPKHSTPIFGKLWQQNGRDTIAAVATALPSSTFWNTWLGSENIVFKVPAQVQLQKFEDGRAVATAATVPRPLCCQSFQKCGVPCLGMNILAGCTTMNFQHGTPKALGPMNQWSWSCFQPQPFFWT